MILLKLTFQFLITRYRLAVVIFSMEQSLPSCSWQEPRTIEQLDRRFDSYFYLIGECIDSFEHRLPTEVEVIKLYCLEWSTMISDADKITRVVNAIVEIWNRTGIKIRTSSSIRQKVKMLISDFKSIIRTRRKGNRLQVDRENKFLIKTTRLFDIAEQKSESQMSSTRKAFLIDQRNERRQCISILEESIFSEYQEDIHENFTVMSIFDSDSDSDIRSDSGTESESSSDYCPSISDQDRDIPKKKLKKGTIKKLDEAGLSYRQMQLAAEAFIGEFNENPKEYCIGVSTFHSNVTGIRKALVEDTIKAIRTNESKLLLLFDTKTYSQINAAHLPGEKRLALVIFNQGCHYALDVSTVINGTAEALSEQMLRTTNHLNLASRMIGLVCDTEVTNTSFKGGACAKFESKITKQLLLLCCRHHILEIVLKKV